MCNDGKCPLNRNGIKHDIEDTQLHSDFNFMGECW